MNMKGSWTDEMMLLKHSKTTSQIIQISGDGQMTDSLSGDHFAAELWN
jgi:hypothetical protein